MPIISFDDVDLVNIFQAVDVVLSCAISHHSTRTSYGFCSSQNELVQISPRPTTNIALVSTGTADSAGTGFLLTSTVTTPRSILLA